jgi:RNA polymerase sigma-70 factor (ECF subfamily)
LERTGVFTGSAKDCGMQKSDRVDEFVALYLKNSRRVYGFVRSLVSHKPDAEDVFQEVGRTLWEKFDQYQSGTNFLMWAFSIARFAIFQHRRMRARQPTSLSDAVFELIAAELLNSSTDEDPRYQALVECLKKLPANDRELIDARYRHGKTTRSVAASVGRSSDAIYRSLRRIHKGLLICVQRRIATERLT